MAEDAPSSQVVLPSQVVMDAPLVFVKAATPHNQAAASGVGVKAAAGVVKQAAAGVVKQAAASGALPSADVQAAASSGVQAAAPLEVKQAAAPWGVKQIGEAGCCDIARSNRQQSPPKVAPAGRTNSYSAIVQGSSSRPQPPNVGAYDFIDPATIPFQTITAHQGVPSIAFSTTAKLQLVSKIPWVLIGKFSHGKPPLSVIQAFFKSLQLQGDVNCALSDSKHLFIECSCYVDYYWIWMQLVLNIQGYNMRLFKWEPKFSSLIESPIAPVWIRIVGLALYLFDERTLLSIASIIGAPIKVDSRNINRSCLSYARVCVELDVSKPLVEEIGITIVDEETGAIVESKKAQILYDVVPKYCLGCSHIGHASTNCKRSIGRYSLEATKRVAAAASAGASQGRSTKVWQRVEAQATAGVSRTHAGSRSHFEMQQGPPTGLQSAGQGASLSSESAAAEQLLLPAEPAQEEAGSRSRKDTQQGPLTGLQSAGQGMILSSQSAATGQSLQLAGSAGDGVAELTAMREEEGSHLNATVQVNNQQQVPLTSASDSLDGVATHNFFDSLRLEESAEVAAPRSTTMHSGLEQLAQGPIHQQISTKLEQQESRAEAELAPKSPKEDEWHLVVSKNKRGSREKASATASAPKNISTRLVFDHNTQDVRSGHSEPRQAQFLRPSWADQVDEECEQPTLQQTEPDTTEDIGDDPDWRAFLKAHFLESSASIEAALQKRYPTPQQVTSEDSIFCTGMEQVDKGHESATKESKEDLHTTRGEDKPRHVQFHELVTVHRFEKEADRRSERLTTKNTSHTEKDFKVRVLDDQHHEGWPLTVSQGKHAYTPGTKAKSNDPG